MRALTWHGKHDVRVDTVPDPEIVNPRDAIIEVTATAICGSDLHLYDGVIAAARGEPAEAEKSLRRALYLDRDLASAHYQLALTLRASGRGEAARRSFANAGRIAGAMPEDAEIAHLDGMNAGALLQLVKLALETTPSNGR